MQSMALKGVVIGGVVVVALLVPTAMLLTTKDDCGGRIVLGIPGVQVRGAGEHISGRS
jgi:hypothetical protein